ncbi:ribulokinase [Rhizobium sp. Leaf384]|uniref:FGGY-family carbohydrate kinase n=1 Tax=unclassified Rhizobium TaxID=2613769 RepID=UPI000715C45B|nr:MULTISPECIES: FGGY-family carbohydrate kinase [unclassified Rhizobium]KQS76988.1 ribulokinase [Rhizobium sp. Leaf384]KQS78259.1 ribulokinase [Rhizobium sp. Leaf383]
MGDLIVAVDIGTGSARAGIFDAAGSLLARADYPILMNRPEENHAEHDSENIWSAVCIAVKTARAKAGVPAEAIAAIGFDATCSLVVRDQDGAPLSVNRKGDPRWDTIVWLDHRALAQADACTATRHPVLVHSGRVMSPEMQMPKLLWLKQTLPEQWERIGYLFDLADFMSWRATGSTVRSRCTLSAKWNYLGHADGWQRDFLEAIGLGDLLERGRLDGTPAPVGSALGLLTAEAAADLGLHEACQVATGVIDAYAGAIGVLGRFAGQPDVLERQLALIAGTSSCIVAFSREMRPGFGMWGPYFEAAFPEQWLIEGGQSATGALLDHVVRSHSAGGEPDMETHARIVLRIQELRAAAGKDFAARLHVLPDFHGNRSPFADPHARGVVSGLTLDSSFDALCRLYWRTCVAIALGVRHILAMMKEAGYHVDTLHVTGGHVRNPLLMDLYSDATGCRVVVPETTDAVLLGTAMIASVAGGLHGDLAAAGAAMSPGGFERQPDPDMMAVYDRDYEKFLSLYRHRAELEAD